MIHLPKASLNVSNFFFILLKCSRGLSNLIFHYLVVQNIEGNLERHRRLQDKEASTHLNSTMEKMRAALEQARGSISTDTKNELRKLSQE